MRTPDSDEEFALLVRDERPEPAPRWAAELDERAAAGFPRGGRSPGGIGAWLSGGGWKVPAGAVATLAVVVGVVVSTYDGSSNTQTASMATSVDKAVGGDQAPSSVSPSFDGSGQAPPIPPQGGVAESSDSVTGSVGYPAAKIAPGTENRKVDRNTQLALSAKPEDVRGVSDEVISITRSLGGIVASSQVTESNGSSSATLELTIPTRNLETAVDRMTALADVDSLNETSTDITKPFVSAQDEVHDAEAERQQLLEALGNATTAAEADALKLRIADARRQISRAQARFDAIARKARLSDLSVTVASNPNASSDRTLGDWLEDAVDVLSAIAGILLIAAAILIPLGLIAAIVAWIATRVRRRRRESSLDE